MPRSIRKANTHTQTLRNFRRLLNTSIDRGIGILRIDVENLFSMAKEKSTARRQNFFGPRKNRDRRFPYYKHANIEQTLAFFRSSLTTSIDRGIEIDRIDFEKSIWFAKEKSTAR